MNMFLNACNRKNTQKEWHRATQPSRKKEWNSATKPFREFQF
jgi:hypothetical protein